jgi:hypothetical protein
MGIFIANKPQPERLRNITIFAGTKMQNFNTGAGNHQGLISAQTRN